MNELIKWLQDNQLDKYADVLKENDIESIDLLTELSEEDFLKRRFLF
jgi:hypothetical protein